MLKILGTMLFVGIVLLIMGIVFSQYQDCNSIGGTFVRGLVWFECIE